MSNEKSILELMTDMKTLADDIIAKSEGVIGCVTEERINPEPAPDKPVDWQVIIDEGLLCDFDGFSGIGQLQDVYNYGHDHFCRLGGQGYWRECTPLPHQSIDVTQSDDVYGDSSRLNYRLSDAGFKNTCMAAHVAQSGWFILVTISGPLDGYTYEVQS